MKKSTQKSPSRKPGRPPSDLKGFEALKRMDAESLQALGLRPWNEPRSPRSKSHDPFKGGTLWLFPGAWYRHIPNGFEFVDIFGAEDVFEKGDTDDDIRFGMLAYGVLIPSSPSPKKP